MDSPPETAAGPAAATADGGTAAPGRRFRPVLTISLAAVATIAVVAALLAVGRPAASRPAATAAKAFALPELGHQGGRVSLAAFTGRAVIVNFFASWCAPCKRETPLLADFYREQHGRVAIIGVDSNDESAAALAFLKSEGVSYPVGFDPFPATVTTSYGVISLPQTFLLNSKHQIVKHIIGAVTQQELNAWAASAVRT
jgi:cytochrome c biogenesis protein CcmG/thiol:disulfide interchange protein DsbE